MYILRCGKAKIVEKAQFIFINEHYEIIFNAAIAEKMHRAKLSLNGFNSYIC